MPLLLELMIPPHYQLGSTVVVCPSRFGVVPGLIPSLAILFSSYNCMVNPLQSPGSGDRCIGSVCELPHDCYFLGRADLQGITVSISFEGVVAVPAVWC
jgi:hypothetical protein